MKILLLISLILSTSAWSKTKVGFVDWCSEKDIRVSTPNGTRLMVELTEIDPHHTLEMIVTFRPAGLLEDLKPQDKATFKFNFAPSAKEFKTLIKLPKTKWMWQVEQRHAEYRIWDAEIKWWQSGANKAGSSIASFYHAPSTTPFFQLQSEGLCQWEEDASIDSKMYENNSTTWMNVTRTSSQSWDNTSNRGISLGYDNNTGSNLPLAPTKLNNAAYGWLFKDWQKQFSQQLIFNVERKYVLSRDEAGIFLKRLSFNRHLVKKFQWSREASHCGEYAETSRGFLDVGTITEDFIVIPKNFHPRPDKLKEFINTVRPPVNNCETSIGTGADSATDILPAGADGILFYYEIDQTKGTI